MNDKEKKRNVWDYQFVVYTPHASISKRVEPGVWEITGHEYPRRNKKFDISWLEVFERERIQRINKNKRKKRR